MKTHINKMIIILMKLKFNNYQKIHMMIKFNKINNQKQLTNKRIIKLLIMIIKSINQFKLKHHLKIFKTQLINKRLKMNKNKNI